MKRRAFLLSCAFGAIAPAFAQAKPARVCMLGARPLVGSAFAPNIVRRLTELGYRDGAGMVFEYRSTDGFLDRQPALIRELIELKCDLIFSLGGEQAERALRNARSSVPVVFIASDYDPVEKGIVASLANPGGKMTGVYAPQAALVAKRMEIMRDVLPSARRFLVLGDMFSIAHIGAARKAAEAAGVQLTVVEFSTQPYDFAGAFETGRRAGAEALLLLNSPVFGVNASTLSGLAVKYRLPTIGAAYAVEAGFLLSYYADVVKASRRVAEIGVRVLQGARPAGIPVEQVDEFQLVINAKTARALGVKIPESVMARATRVVQ